MSTMNNIVILSFAAFTLGALIFMSARSVRAYLQARGKRLVVCPETHCAAAVELDARTAGIKAFRGGQYLCLKDCSRWPEMKDCAQDCLVEVEALGARCLIGNIVAGWYRDKSCVFCHKAVGSAADWTGHFPALLAPDSTTLSWDAVAPEKLPEVFATHQPVCWSCHIAETFRREHADLVTDRPARW